VKTFAVAAVVLGLVITVLLVWHMDRALPRTSVTEQHSGFDTGQFLMLLFPTSENKVCRRAVLASLDEYERDTIEFHKDGGVVVLARDRFTATPPAEYLTFAERLSAELDLWGEETDWRSIEWDFKSGTQEITATLRGEDKRGTLRKYTYRIDGTAVHPISITTKVDMAKKMAN
jgi:hypothetical protein